MATNLANGSFNPPPPAGTGTDGVFVFRDASMATLPEFQLFQAGSSTVYTNSYNDTSDPNGTPVAYRFYINNTDPGNLEPLSDYDNRAAYLPTNSGASLVLPTAFYGGNGPVVSINVKFQVDMSEEIELGNFKPSLGNTVVIAGSFNSWSPSAGSQYVLTNDPSILITNFNFGIPGGLVESNIYTCTVPVTTCANTGTGSGGLAVTNEDQEWKYVEMPAGGWETPGPASDDHSANRFFLDNTNQTLPIVSFSDEIYAPLANVTFNVDMTTMARFDTNFVPNSVSVWGTFNGWAGPLVMTNNTAAPNTNLYSGTTNVPEGISFIYQFRYTNSFINGWVYDYAQDGGPTYFNNNSYRRTVTVPVTSTLLNTNFPAVYFDDLAPDDCLPAATAVLFSVDMSGAVATNGYVFQLRLGSRIYKRHCSPAQLRPCPTSGDAQSWYAWAGGINPLPSSLRVFKCFRKGRAQFIPTPSYCLPEHRSR